MKLNSVFINATNCITPLGLDVETNIRNISNGVSGIRLHKNQVYAEQPFYASIIEDDLIEEAFSSISASVEYTRLEKMMILALMPVIKKSNPVFDEKTILIVSTTKGNITQLNTISETSVQSADLSLMAKKIASFFGFTTEPVIVSNACVSGILSLAVAKRLIQSEGCNQAFVVAGDEFSKFVLSGFNCFQAVSDEPCQPYSVNRKGVTLGEAAAAACVSANGQNALAEIAGDGAINDANHISGPSRTGEGLFRSVERAMQEAEVKAEEIDYINAHGTATSFNDEMEAIAFNRSRLGNVPLNSLKGYYGHTLGASGLLETVIGIESLNSGKLYSSIGFDEMGLSQPLNIITQNEDKELNYLLKTASGFGGCNTAVLFKKTK
jgi:3-oxoacyl-[acyl-carrier-protein] synthase-1